MRHVLALSSMLLVAAACGDTATTSSAAAPPAGTTATTAAPVTTAAPATTAPPATTTTAAPPTTVGTTTMAAKDLPDIEAVADCEALLDAGIELLQAVFDDLGEATLDDLDAAGGTLPGLDLLEVEGEKLDVKTEELGCDRADLEAGLRDRVDELEPRGEVGRLLIAAFSEELPEPGEAEPPEGVEAFTVDDASHTEGPVAYPQDPPVGGPHHPIWQNCGFYSEPVGTEHAVHSLEHGAVWVTYDAGFATDIELAALMSIADEPKVLVSPYEGLGDTPVVASAWGAQLRLESALDPRLEQFVGAFRDVNAPEPGAPCEGGVGDPE